MDKGEFAAIAVLTAQLPHESRTIRRMHPELAWGEGDYILAIIADQLANIAYGLGGGKGKKPKPIPRPKAPRKKKEKLSLSVGRDRVKSLLFASRAPVPARAGEEGKGVADG